MTTWTSTIGYPVAFRPPGAWQQARAFDHLKLVADFLLTLVLLVLTAPLLLVCLAWVKLASPGPAILRQMRLGKDGRAFAMYKLRTMVADAEARTGPVLAAANDARVVPSCRWMRRCHVDELPQLVNVLRGQMSLVGPRPERPEIAERIYESLPDFRFRLQVRPGITGLAQVCNGYDTCLDAMRHKLGYDMRYIRQRGWRMDLWILGKTLTKLRDSASR